VNLAILLLIGHEKNFLVGPQLAVMAKGGPDKGLPQAPTTAAVCVLASMYEQ
jgi:hypothetical protein